MGEMENGGKSTISEIHIVHNDRLSYEITLYIMLIKIFQSYHFLHYE